MHGPADRELIDSILAGDADAYRALVEREAASVMRLCTVILHDPGEAQDVAQEAFMLAYRALAGYRGDGTFGAWIGRIATRLARSRAVKRGSRPIDSITSFEASLVDVNADPQRQVSQRQHAEALRRAIARLPADQREVVTMRFYDDMALDQIAASTRTPVGTVKSRLHRALARLRDENDLRSSS